jgi:hypothetical protein
MRNVAHRPVTAMSNFANRMLEARRNRQERRNRGEAVGNHGTRPLTAAERRQIDPVYADELEAGIAAIVLTLADRCAQERADMELYLLENTESGGILEIPF